MYSTRSILWHFANHRDNIFFSTAKTRLLASMGSPIYTIAPISFSAMHARRFLYQYVLYLPLPRKCAVRSYSTAIVSRTGCMSFMFVLAVLIYCIISDEDLFRFQAACNFRHPTVASLQLWRRTEVTTVDYYQIILCQLTRLNSILDSPAVLVLPVRMCCVWEQQYCHIICL